MKKHLSKIAFILIIGLIALLIMLTATSCRQQTYCPAYSGARYNAAQKGYPAKYNAIQAHPRKAY